MLCSRVRVILCAYVETTVYEAARQQESRSKIMSKEATLDTFGSLSGRTPSIGVTTIRNQAERCPADHRVLAVRRTDCWMSTSAALVAAQEVLSPAELSSLRPPTQEPKAAPPTTHS